MMRNKKKYIFGKFFRSDKQPEPKYRKINGILPLNPDFDRFNFFEGQK